MLLHKTEEQFSIYCMYANRISYLSAHSKLSIEFRLNNCYWLTRFYIFAFLVTRREAFEKMGVMSYASDCTAEKLFSFCNSGTFAQLKNIFQMQKICRQKMLCMAKLFVESYCHMVPNIHMEQWSVKVTRISRISRSH